MTAPLTFFARVVGATGAFAAAVGTGNGTVPNPLGAAVATAVAARTGAGVYTITLGAPLPIGEYLYELGIEGGAGNANIQVAIAGAVINVTSFVGAVATDENFWIKISRVPELDGG